MKSLPEKPRVALLHVAPNAYPSFRRLWRRKETPFIYPPLGMVSDLAWK